MGHPISVFTNQPLQQVLHRPEVSGHLIKWSIELSEFHIVYRPQPAIKGQAVSDFVSEFTPTMLITNEQVDKPASIPHEQEEPILTLGPT